MHEHQIYSSGKQIRMSEFADFISFPNHMKEYVFELTEIDLLRRLYSQFYPDTQVDVPVTCRRSASLTFFDHMLGSAQSRSARNSFVFSRLGRERGIVDVSCWSSAILL
jgi:hypothetical protein